MAKSQGCVGCMALIGVAATAAIAIVGFMAVTSPTKSDDPRIDPEVSPTVRAAGAEAQEYDIAKPYDLRSGPGNSHERMVNQKASDALGKIHYLSVDTSTSVQILQSQGEWVEIQVTQPDHLRASHRGWVPRDAIKDGQSTTKLEGWIRHTCRVYPSPGKSSEPIGYLSSPSSVGVADDGSGWLRLLHGPVKDETTHAVVELAPDLYIEKSSFTTDIPAKWEQ